MAEKPPYRMTIRLSSARPDAIGEALTEIRSLAGDYDQAVETSATLSLESYKEAPLRTIYEMFELWLYSYKIGIECEVKLAQPGVRPETIAAMRATRNTPMDRAGWEQDEEDNEDEDEDERKPIIIAPPLALPPARLPALTVDDGSFTIEG
jgi:hypothetical protein